jgi:hypothetical protein
MHLLLLLHRMRSRRRRGWAAVRWGQAAAIPHASSTSASRRAAGEAGVPACRQVHRSPRKRRHTRPPRLRLLLLLLLQLLLQLQLQLLLQLLRGRPPHMLLLTWREAHGRRRSRRGSHALLLLLLLLLLLHCLQSKLHGLR